MPVTIKIHGFNLIELMVTVTLVSILTLVAIPSFQSLWQRHKATSTINELLGLLQFARIQALASGQYISVCAYSSNSSCGSDWNKGLYIFVDEDIDGEIDSQADIIRQYKRTDNDSKITFNAALNAMFINYTPLGTSFRKNNGGNIVYCIREGTTQYSKVIVFFRTGRAYLGPDRNGNGVPENGSGKDVEC